MSLKYLGIDYYSIEKQEGEKVVVLHGYFYYADGSCTDNPDETYRAVLYSYHPIPLKDFIDNDKANNIDEITELWLQYIDDLTEDEVTENMDNYYGDELPKELKLTNLTMDTPCGEYVDYEEGNECE